MKYFGSATQDPPPKQPKDSSTSHTTDVTNKSGSNSTSNSEELLSFGTVKKRHSAGDAIDRNTKSKSLFLPDYRLASNFISLYFLYLVYGSFNFCIHLSCIL